MIDESPPSPNSTPSLEKGGLTARISAHKATPFIALALILIALVLSLYQVVDAPMAFDDLRSTHTAKTATSWTQSFSADPFGLFRPVKSLFFYYVEQFGGGPKTYHTGTIIAYLIATVGVFTLVSQLTSSRNWGAVGAALWAFTAPNGTIAAWTSCVNISIAAASMAFALAAFDRWRSEGGPKTAAIIFFLSTVLALLSYESAICIPMLCILVDTYRGRRLFNATSFKIYGSLIAIIIVWLVIRHFGGASTASIQNPTIPKDMEAWKLTASAPYFLWTHFQMWAAPWGRLEFFGSYLWDKSIPAVIMPFCWFLLLGVSILCVRFWSSASLFVVGLAWFFFASAPSGNFLPIGNTPYADYYVPIPAIGLTISLIAMLRGCLNRYRQPATSRLSDNPQLRTIAGVTFLAIILWRGAVAQSFHHWANLWNTPVLILAETSAARPYQYVAKAIAADFLFDPNGHGDSETAEKFARASLNDAPVLALPYMVLGGVSLERGERAQALEYFQQSLKLRHVSVETQHFCVWMTGLLTGEDPKRAAKTFEILLPLLQDQSSSYHISAIFTAADTFRRAGIFDQELAVLEKAAGYHPENKEIADALESARNREQPKDPE